LLVEDSDPDAEMTARALRKGGLVNKLVRVRDGVEALEFMFRSGPWSTRDSAGRAARDVLGRLPA